MKKITAMILLLSGVPLITPHAVQALTIDVSNDLTKEHYDSLDIDSIFANIEYTDKSKCSQYLNSGKRVAIKDREQRGPPPGYVARKQVTLKGEPTICEVVLTVQYSRLHDYCQISKAGTINTKGVYTFDLKDFKFDQALCGLRVKHSTTRKR